MNVSVVIPNYNGRTLLQKHLPVVLAAVRKNDEVIVVDDASTDDSVAFLRNTFPQVKIVQHETNLRFAQSCNDGVSAATNEIVVLLNSDVSPQKDFLLPLVKHFEDERVFSVGCLELDDTGKESGRAAGAFLRGMLIHRRATHQETGDSLWSSGGSMAVRKSLWEKFGGMDVMFKPAYEEDRDLCYRALKMGYRVLFERKSQVLHQHETTNSSALGKSKLQIASYKNSFVFFWKNVTDGDLVFQHLLWLPYHLIVGGIKTNGLLVRGFLQALAQFGEVLEKRKKGAREWRLTDHEVIEKVRNI